MSKPDRAASAESGTTLIELMTVLALLSVVSALFTGLLLSLQTAQVNSANRSRSNDEARLAIGGIDRLVRSGNVLYNPSSEMTDTVNSIYPGTSMRVYTQANGVQRCVQWRIKLEKLELRSWSSAWRVDNEVSGWRTVAENVVNRTVTPVVPAFVLDTSQAGFGSRLMSVTIVVNAAGANAKPVVVTSSVTGRNTQYGYQLSVCDDIPPY